MTSSVMLDRPWLTFDLGAPMRVLSWAINQPGFVTARRIVWREVRNADLPEGLDVRHWLGVQLETRGVTDSVAFLTSRNIDRYRHGKALAGEASAEVVATIGLSNAERVGLRQPSHPLSYGTINVAARLDAGLSEAGLIEALSVAVQARTAAILDAQVALNGGAATGTGTDCVAIAAPAGEAGYTGLHTDIGEALGRAVYDTVWAGAQDWKDEQEVTADA